MRLLSWWKRRREKQAVFADASRVEAMRDEIDAFLHNVLPEEEREFIDSSFISDEATIFDCSLATREDWKRNCRKAFGVQLSDLDLEMSLWRLVEVVRERTRLGK